MYKRPPRARAKPADGTSRESRVEVKPCQLAEVDRSHVRHDPKLAGSNPARCSPRPCTAGPSSCADSASHRIEIAVRRRAEVSRGEYKARRPSADAILRRGGDGPCEPAADDDRVLRSRACSTDEVTADDAGPHPLRVVTDLDPLDLTAGLVGDDRNPVLARH